MKNWIKKPIGSHKLTRKQRRRIEWPVYGVVIGVSALVFGLVFYAFAESLLIEQSTTNEFIFSLNNLSGTYYAGQTFQTTADQYTITQVDVYIESDGTRDWTMTINADGGTSPSTQLGTKTISYQSDSPTWTSFIFDTPIEVAGSTTYWMVLSHSGEFANYYRIYGDNGGNPYANGSAYTNSGSWTISTNNDYAFRVYGNDTPPDEITSPADESNFDLNEEIDFSGTCDTNGTNNYRLYDDTDAITIATLSCTDNAWAYDNYIYDDYNDIGSHNIHLEYGTQSPYLLVDEITITINAVTGAFISPTDDEEFTSLSFFRAEGTCNNAELSDFFVQLKDTNGSVIYVSDNLECATGLWDDSTYALTGLSGLYSVELWYIHNEYNGVIAEAYLMDTVNFTVGDYTSYWVRIDSPEDNGLANQYTVNPDTLTFYGTVKQKSISWDLEIEKSTSSAFSTSYEVSYEKGFTWDTFFFLQYDLTFSVDQSYNWYRFKLLDASDNIKYTKIIYVSFDAESNLTLTPIWYEYYPEYFGYGNYGYGEPPPEASIDEIISGKGLGTYINKIKNYAFGRLPLCLYSKTIGILSDTSEDLSDITEADESIIITLNYNETEYNFDLIDSSTDTNLDNFIKFYRTIITACWDIILLILAVYYLFKHNPFK